MFFKKRKKDISNKLREMNFPEDKIKLLISINYDLIGILNGDYLRFETQINDTYYLLQRELADIKKSKLEYNEKKGIFYSITNTLPIITSKPSPY
jgi:hypothetical protein